MPKMSKAGSHMYSKAESSLSEEMRSFYVIPEWLQRLFLGSHVVTVSRWWALRASPGDRRETRSWMINSSPRAVNQSAVSRDSSFLVSSPRHSIHMFLTF
jgi:hypothetical protein